MLSSLYLLHLQHRAALASGSSLLQEKLKHPLTAPYTLALLAAACSALAEESWELPVSCWGESRAGAPAGLGLTKGHSCVPVVRCRAYLKGWHLQGEGPQKEMGK